MKTYIIALDAGTTSCRSLLVDSKGKILNIVQKEITSFYPNSGWVEQDALEIWNTQLQTLQSLKNNFAIHTEQIAAIGITNQRETLIAWDKSTGLPVEKAIVWQDRRTAKMCQDLKAEGVEEKLKSKTGLTLDPYFSATKLAWLLQNSQEVKKKLEQGNLLVGTVDTWLIWKLTEGESFVTDVTNASRTALFNIHSLDWDQELLEIFGIPRNILPTVLPSNAKFGEVKPHFLSQRAKYHVPIHGVAGDQQAALFGQMCFETGQVKNTYGTGCFALVNIGNEVKFSTSGLVTTVAWQLEGQKAFYALEGSVFVAGAGLKWLRDSLRIVHSSPEIDFYSEKAQKNSNIYVVHGFSGLGAPYWDPQARGAILGLELGTTREDFLKGFLEGIAFHSQDLFSAMANDLKTPLSSIAVDGGAANSNYLMQFQASVSNLPVLRPLSVETTALGAAYLAGLGVGFWKNQAEIKSLHKIEQTFVPNMSEEERVQKLSGWKDAVSRVLTKKG